MPTTTGTSFKGLQLLNTMPAVPSRFLYILLPTSNRARRLVRMGTVLVTYRELLDAQPVMAVWKLYGDGMAVNIPPEVLSVPAEIWVSWFVNAIPWRCVTKDA